MPRFRKSTMDHDGDGRKGGSLKGDKDMVKVVGATKGEQKIVKAAKKVAAKPKPVEAEAPKPKAKETPEQQAARVEQADLDESVGRHPGGMEPPLSEDQRAAALEAEFARADAVGDPRRDELAAIKQVRGF